ncbi:MAG: hypothetical protein GXY48_12225 [Methanomicrobiales archaeon]|nr:hypothetical protein [Methanomicrobiales archaeon]
MKTSSRANNTGMGLFLISEILELTGIPITENGTYGAGVRFEMRVPEGGWRIICDEKFD